MMSLHMISPAIQTKSMSAYIIVQIRLFTTNIALSNNWLYFIIFDVFDHFPACLLLIKHGVEIIWWEIGEIVEHESPSVRQAAELLFEFDLIF